MVLQAYLQAHDVSDEEVEEFLHLKYMSAEENEEQLPVGFFTISVATSSDLSQILILGEQQRSRSSKCNICNCLGKQK